MWKRTKNILAETCVTAVKPLANSAAELREKQCMKLSKISKTLVYSFAHLIKYNTWSKNTF